MWTWLRRRQRSSHVDQGGQVRDHLVVYRATGSNKYNDQFEVTEGATEALLARLPYLFETQPSATIAFNVTVGAASSLFLAPLALVFLVLAALF